MKFAYHNPISKCEPHKIVQCGSHLSIKAIKATSFLQNAGSSTSSLQLTYSVGNVGKWLIKGEVNEVVQLFWGWFFDYVFIPFETSFFPVLLLIHFPFIFYSCPIQFLLISYSNLIHFLFNSHSFPIHFLVISYSILIHVLFKVLFISNSFLIHFLFIFIHILFISFSFSFISYSFPFHVHSFLFISFDPRNLPKSKK